MPSKNARIETNCAWIRRTRVCNGCEGDNAGWALLVIGLLLSCAATPEKRSTGEVIDDATITTKVKANLLADPMVSSFAISVETSRGVVSLTGIVNSAGERAQAVRVAQETGGVRRVDARNLFIKQ
jgi:hyperosmotically inducible protein